MDGDDLLCFQDIVHVFCVGCALIDVAVHGAHEPVIFGFSVRRGQLRSRGCRGDVGDACLPENRCAGRRRARAGGPKNDGGIGIGGELRRRGLSAFGVAAVVLHAQLDGMADQRSALVFNGDLHSALFIDAERRIGARHDPIGANLDRRALGDHKHADIIGEGTLCLRGGRGCSAKRGQR